MVVQLVSLNSKMVLAAIVPSPPPEPVQVLTAVLLAPWPGFRSGGALATMLLVVGKPATVHVLTSSWQVPEALAHMLQPVMVPEYGTSTKP
jgi:hypothetical protein